jgi:hypothetical protein
MNKILSFFFILNIIFYDDNVKGNVTSRRQKKTAKIFDIIKYIFL